MWKLHIILGKLAAGYIEMTFWGKTEDDTLKTSKSAYRNANMTLTLATFQITTSKAIPLHNLIKETE